MSDSPKDDESPRSRLYAPPPLPPLLPPSPGPIDEDEDEHITAIESVTSTTDEKVVKDVTTEIKRSIVVETPMQSAVSTTSAASASASAENSTETKGTVNPSSLPFHPEIPKLPEFTLLPPESIRPIAPPKPSPKPAEDAEPKRYTPAKKGMSSTAKRLAELASLQSTIRTDRTPLAAKGTEMTDSPTTADSSTSNAEADTTKTPVRPKRPIEPIFYDLGPSPSADSALKARVIQERKKQLDRLLRFSTPTEPEEDISISPITETTVLGARRAAVRRGFATGFDTTTPEEEQKRLARIKRFGAPETHPFYKPDEDVSARAARAERFGQEAIAAATEANQKSLPPVRTLETRRTPEEDENPRPTVIHLFGVDRLSTKDVVNYFSSYGPSWCEWLNDSSCNIVFEDAYTMRRALRGMSVGSDPSLLADAMEEDSDGKDGADGSDDKKDKAEDPGRENEDEKKEDEPEDGKLDMDVSNDEPPIDDLVWRQMKPFNRKGRTTPLWGRMATDKDVRPERPNPNSKWSRTVRRQHILLNVDEDGYTFFTSKKGLGKRPHSVMRDRNSIQKTAHPRKVARADGKMDMDEE